MRVKEFAEAWGKKRDICMTPEQRIKQLEAENKRMTTVKCRQFECIHNNKGECKLQLLTLQADSIPIISKLICVEAKKKKGKAKDG